MPRMRIREKAWLARTVKSPTFWWIAFACWCVTLFVLSSITFDTKVPTLTNLDKVAHFGYFLGGGFAFSTALFLQNRQRLQNPIATATATILTMALVGALDEWHQTFTPGRMGLDPLDWMADVLGGVAGCLIAFAMIRRLPATRTCGKA